MEEGDHYQGYILSFFHQLHCLVSSPSRFVRKSNSQVYYNHPT